MVNAALFPKQLLHPLLDPLGSSLEGLLGPTGAFLDDYDNQNNNTDDQSTFHHSALIIDWVQDVSWYWSNAPEVYYKRLPPNRKEADDQTPPGFKFRTSLARPEGHEGRRDPIR